MTVMMENETQTVDFNETETVFRQDLVHCMQLSQIAALFTHKCS